MNRILRGILSAFVIAFIIPFVIYNNLRADDEDYVKKQ